MSQLQFGGFGTGNDFGNRKKFAIGELNALGDRRLPLFQDASVRFSSLLGLGFAVCEVISWMESKQRTTTILSLKVLRFSIVSDRFRGRVFHNVWPNSLGGISRCGTRLESNRHRGRTLLRCTKECGTRFWMEARKIRNRGMRHRPRKNYIFTASCSHLSGICQSSTGLQLSSGSKSSMALAVSVVVFPRSFWKSTPS